MSQLKPYLRKLSLPGMLGVLFFQSVALAEEPVRLNFGVYSSNKPSAMVKIFKPTLNVLEQKMSLKLRQPVDIRLQIAKDYNQGIEHLSSGKVDFSRFGPSSYIEAKRMNGGLEILAVESKKQDKVFYGIIAVHQDSEITDISQLKGKSFAFGDKGSTIGRFLSQLYLEQHDVRAADLSSYDYLGRHDKVGTAVGAGAYAAGALNESTFKKLVEKGEKIRELARFPNVTKPWIARAGLEPRIFQALQESLLEINEKSAMKGLKIDGFLEGSDADYSVIRTAMESNFVFFSDPVTAAAQATLETRTNLTSTTPVHATVPSVIQEANASPSQTLHTAIPVESSNSEGNSITINITLPASLFGTSTNELEASNNLTINLTIPKFPEPAELISATANDL